MFAKELKLSISSQPVLFNRYLFHHRSGKKLEWILTPGYPGLPRDMILYG
jgi:hypothetical protein